MDKRISCAAFDCFGTVFNADSLERDLIREYVQHVRQNDFSPFHFPDPWWNLEPHPDSVEGIRQIQSMGIKCVALSNGSKRLLSMLGVRSGIRWDHVVDLVSHRVYKPHDDAYLTVEKDLGIPTDQTAMVTANPLFGDVEGSARAGMSPVVIRNGVIPSIIDLAKALADPNPGTSDE